MIFIVIRIMIVIWIKDPKNRLLIYFGSPWHLLGGNQLYHELLMLFWALYAILYYLLAIQTQHKPQEWLRIFSYLSGIIHYERIGIITTLNLYYI